jgi:hypothetical protein
VVQEGDGPRFDQLNGPESFLRRSCFVRRVYLPKKVPNCGYFECKKGILKLSIGQVLFLVEYYSFFFSSSERRRNNRAVCSIRFAATLATRSSLTSRSCKLVRSLVGT